MDYINNKKKVQPIQPGAIQPGPGASIQPVQPVVSTMSTGSKPQTDGGTSQHSSTTSYGRSGVSEQTANTLAGYAAGYKPSDAVTAAEEYLRQIQGQRPGEYQSPYQQQLDDMLSQIQGRKPFSYDLNADMLYQQYRDQYKNLGQQAMMDTMGQAAGLTGGYGSSYSQNAGQQAYQSYLQQLNDKVPELYRLALDKYNAEGDEMYRQYGLLNDRENTAYGRYRDTVGDWRADLSDAYNRYTDERGFDYGQWNDMLNYWQAQADRENSEWWQQTEFDYQKERDAVKDAQWQKEFDAAQAARAAAARASSSAYDDLLAKYNYLLGKIPGQNPYYEQVPGTNQGRVEIPGYGTVSFDQYQQMLQQGLLEPVTYDKKTGTYSARMKPGQNKGPFNMIM